MFYLIFCSYLFYLNILFSFLNSNQFTTFTCLISSFTASPLHSLEGMVHFIFSWHTARISILLDLFPAALKINSLHSEWKCMQHVTGKPVKVCTIRYSSTLATTAINLTCPYPTLLAPCVEI